MSSDIREQSTLAWLIDEHSMGIAIVLYVLAVTPLYFWLTGSVGVEGQIGGGIAMIALVFGALMFVPGIMTWLRQKKFDLGFAEAQQAKDRMVVDTTEQTGGTADRFRTGSGDD